VHLDLPYNGHSLVNTTDPIMQTIGLEFILWLEASSRVSSSVKRRRIAPILP